MPQQALTEAVFYILLSLLKPLHGYGIIQNVGELSKGRIKLAPGTLYGALNSLVDKGWIDALPENPESRKKEYVITGTGKAVLKDEIDRLAELVDNGRKILGEKRT
jgi:DNA-binding PadR family transcriptional regulator